MKIKRCGFYGIFEIKTAEKACKHRDFWEKKVPLSSFIFRELPKIFADSKSGSPKGLEGSNPSLSVQSCMILYHVALFVLVTIWRYYFRGGKCFIVQRKNTDIIKGFESDGIVITIEYTKISSLTVWKLGSRWRYFLCRKRLILAIFFSDG